MFNRPAQTSRTLHAIKSARPKQLFVIADGSRSNIPGEFEKVNDCSDFLKLVDWECEVVKIFSEVNLGCLRRVVTGLDIVFKNVDKAIIIEDDCMPTLNFFKFTEWGLKEFQNDPLIGMIAGSNLVSHKYRIDSRNGFSTLMNPWG